MRLTTFRQIFTLILSVTLSGFGIYLGLQLPFMPSFLGLPSGPDLINKIPNYNVFFTVALGAVGMLSGFWVGPRFGDVIMQMGRRLEQMSAADKIAVGLGTFLGALVTLTFSFLFFQIPMALPFRIGIPILLSVIFIYLGIVSIVSMKTEVFSILARGGGGTQPEPEEKDPTINCKILDTNVIIDGRISDVCHAGFIEGTLYVPGFVLEELQHIADSGDSLKRARGRRGLDILNNMQKELPLVVRSWDKVLDKTPMNDEVDSRLVRLAKALGGSIVTNDFNLNKVAVLQGVQVLNINLLANALKPVVLPGEIMNVGIVKEGKEPNQGVAYLDDGTMIVVEDGRRYLGDTMPVVVTSVLQTAAGKMIFARTRGEDDGEGFDYSNARGAYGDGSSNGSNATSSSGYTRRGTGKKIR